MKLYEILDGKKKEKSFSCIYMWENLYNKKKYIGQTQNFYTRMAQYSYKGGNIYLNRAIEKYGIDNFEITVLEYVSKEYLDEREQYWLDFYKSYLFLNGYNICRYASSTRGYKHTQEVKNKLRKMKIDNPVCLCGEKNPMYGKKHSLEWRKQQAEKMKEKWEKDEEYRNFWHEKMTGENNYFYGVHLTGEKNPMFGKKHSEQTRKKISDSKKGKFYGKTVKIQCVETGKIYISISQASKELNVNVNAIYSILDKPNRTCKKLHFIKV